MIAFVLVTLVVQTVSDPLEELAICKGIRRGKKPHIFDIYKLHLTSVGGYCAVHSCSQNSLIRETFSTPLIIRSLTTMQSNGAYLITVMVMI